MKSFLVLVMAFACGAALAAPGANTLEVATPGGEYSVSLRYQDATGAEQSTPSVKSVGGKASLSLEPLGSKFSNVTLVAVDGIGNAAVKPLPLKPGVGSAASVTAADVNSVYTFRVRVLDSSRQPAGAGMVTLKDAKGKTRSQALAPGRDGVAEFELVPAGKASVKVAFGDGTALTQELTVSTQHPAGPLAIEVAQAAPAGLAGTPANGTAPAAPANGTAPAAGTPSAAVPVTPGTPGAPAPAAAPAALAAPVAPPAAPPAAPPSGGGPGIVGNLIGLFVLAAVGYVAWRVIRERGITLDSALKSVGVQVPAGEPAAAPGAPAAAPAPKPVVPEGHCPFCGQPKDATGACACSVGTGPVAAAAPLGPSPLPGGGGPRLLVVQGPALGASFPLAEMASIGRAADNQVALPQDTTVSRRHATLARGEGGYVLRDEGSANGTFVNGMRITERVLQPGDELQVGSSRLRFEA